MLRSLWKTGQIFALSSESIVLGRNRSTGVTDLKCSKRQVSLLFDKVTKSVRLKSLGKRRVTVNGRILDANEEIIIKFGDVFELLPGKFGYRYEDSMDSDKSCESSEVFSIVDLKKEENDFKNEENNARKSENDLKNRENDEFGWKNKEKVLIFNSPGLEHRSKIASFDLDGTLITTQSGHRFPKDDDDWRILYPEVPKTLKNFHRNGFKIVLFTNQKGISLGHHDENQFKTKIERIQTKLGVPLQCFVSSGDGIFRKPLTGMWDEMEKRQNNGVVLDRRECFYVGDAAGRDEIKNKRKKDHSYADRLFAMNLNLKFLTPEEFFLGRTQGVEPFSMPSFDPKRLATNQTIFEPDTTRIDADRQEILIMIGYPASGKSTFVETYLEPKGYVSISRDDLKSWKKCVSVAENLLQQGKSLVIDNTNGDVQSRARYLQLTQATSNRNKVSSRCFWMNVDLDHARHNNKFRQLAGLADTNHKGVTDMILYAYRKNFQEPQTSEGFDEIVRVNFVPKFDDKELEDLYFMYLLEK